MKKILSVLIAVVMLMALAVPAVAANQATLITGPIDSDYNVLRGYSGDDGSYSISGLKLNLNGNGVVAASNKVVWDSTALSGESGIEFRLTFKEDYSTVGDNGSNYHFAVALMDSQKFQGIASGHGLGADFTLTNEGKVRGMGFYYDGAASTDLQYVGRNLTHDFTATEDREIAFKLAYNPSSGWTFWADKNGDGAYDTILSRFNPTDTVVEGNSAQYFPTNLITGGEAFIVFGAYGTTPINMDVQIKNIYTNFSFGEKVVAPNSVSSTNAYTVSDKYVQFIAADDANFVTADNGSWTVANQAGAIGGKAIISNGRSDNAEGDGITLKFYAPTDGTYYVWARVYYATQLENSLYYKVDDAGAAKYVWDFADEDAADCECYGSWQYALLTMRETGTYTADEGYGSYTVQYSDWRHAPNALELTAGYHTLKLVGREDDANGALYIDEFIVTNYDAEAYDPNEFTGNDRILDECKFCGTDAHYVADVYAITGESAQSYFTRVLHADAAAYTLPLVRPDGDTDGDSGDRPSTDDDEDEDEGKETEAPETTKAADDTEAVEEEKGGCGSNIGAYSIVMLCVVLGMSLTVITKKKAGR